ncbi:MAG TPA: ATP-binding protein, partial [Hyphomicrobiaceae bacterium]|nr:ATP-binding protein [Hyphomicrobiaceae bacterium]
LAEKTKFQSVVFNLVSNARDAVGDDGTVTVSLGNCPSQQRPASIPPGDYVVVSVSDNGCGMPPEVLARAGEPFFTTKSEGRGTGLGLASAFELADQCSGRVLIDSAPGSGTRVSIYLPRASDTGDSDVELAVAATRADHDKHGGATILVVKSDPSGRQHVANLLRRLGYVVLEAASEAVALATALREMRIDLVISDLAALPGGAARLADRLRQEMPTLPFIFIRSEDQMDAVPGELSIVRPVTAAVLAGAVLTKLGRLPAVLLSSATLTASERILERVESDAVRDFGAAWLAHCTATTRLPSPADLQPILDSHADNTYVVSALGSDDVTEFKFVRAGAAIVTAVGHTITDDFITSSDQNVLGYLSRAYKRSATGMPYRDTTAAPGDGAVEYERLIVPLSADGHGVTHLAGIAIRRGGAR